MLIELVQKIRPAPLQSWVAATLGLNRRRVVDFIGRRFYVDPSSHFGSHIIQGAYEGEMIETLEAYLKPGGTFLDIGANEGFYTVLASQLVGPAGKVVAVEPQTRLIPVIEKNLELNDCHNCQVEECVLGAETAMMTFHLAPAANTGSSSLFPITKYKLPTQQVQSRTLADLLDRTGLDTVDLVKIDVEGAEYDVIMPAGEVLKTGRLKTIALEYHPTVLESRGLTMTEIHQLMVASGYRLDERTDNSIYAFVGLS